MIESVYYLAEEYENDVLITMLLLLQAEERIDHLIMLVYVTWMVMVVLVED